MTDNLQPNPMDYAVEVFIRETGRVSESSITRHFRISYARAVRILDFMERRGVVSSRNEKGFRSAQ